MLVMVVFFIAFRWIHLSTPLIRLFLLVLILLLMPTLNFLPVWFALSLLRFRLPFRLPMMFILWMVAMMVVFFFSSRRRHTRSLCDWSSDVCSSDLDRFPREHANFRLLPPREGGLAALKRIVAEAGSTNRSEERRVGKECRPLSRLAMLYKLWMVARMVVLLP